MQQEEIYRLIETVIKDMAPIDWVALRESWIIVECTNGRPTLEQIRYYCFFNRGREYEGGREDLIVLTKDSEAIVARFIEERLGLKRFSPGADDAKSLIGVWA